MKTIASVATVLSLGAVCLVPACGTTPDICGGDRCVQGDGGGDSTTMDGPVGNPEASMDGGGDVGPMGDGGGADGDAFTCDPNGDPSVEPCVVDNMYGLFVAPPASGGSDTTGTGTKEAPYATIGHALQNLMGKTRVYVCTATYAEPVTETSAQNASLYGGLTCPGADGGGGGWVYTAGMRAKVAPTTRGAALTVTGTTQATTIADLEFDAMAAESGQAGGSSIAAMVSGATGLALTRVKLVALGGAAGATGGAFTNNYFAGSLNGNNANGSGGGGAIACTCAQPNAAASSGGSGGQGQVSLGGDGGDGTSNPKAVASGALDGKGGGGGSVTPPPNCSNGDRGANGAGGGGGATGVGGSLTSSGWSGASGGAGVVADPGQGGGGGGGSAAVTVGAGGGGGACGGCGGGAGLGGTGGGASIALALVNSTVTLVSCDLVTATGGAGGAGSVGEAGQGGGTPGLSPGCNGGAGGQGGGGGGGGGGAGGPSVGIAFTGTTTLTVDGKALTANTATLGGPSSFSGGAAGGGGAGGAGGSGASATYNGVTGVTGSPGASGAVEKF